MEDIQNKRMRIAKVLVPLVDGLLYCEAEHFLKIMATCKYCNKVAET